MVERHLTRVFACATLALLLWAPTLADGYPRIGNLWGASVDSTDYDRWARYDLLILGGGEPSSWRRFSAQVRRRNPDIRLLTTAPLMDILAPEETPWMKPEWYLRRPDGELVKWWGGRIHAPNLFNDDCIEALLQQSEQAAGELLDEGVIDGIFYDSVVGQVTWYGEVDTDGDGVADQPEQVNEAWRARQNLFFNRIRERHPDMLILANDVDAGHARYVNGRLFEGAPLLDRLLTGVLVPRDAIRILNQWMATSRQPGITLAIMTQPTGWQSWRVGKPFVVTTPGELDRARRDFRRMRLGLCTALMTDAFYSYDFGTVWYGLSWWYAEYSAPLGNPLGPAQELSDVPPVPLLDWRAGNPTDGLILDPPSVETPNGIETDIPDPEAGWTRLFATDFRKMRFEPGKTYRVRATLDILRQPGKALQFNLRTPTGGWRNHDKGVQSNRGPAGSTWEIDATVVPDDFPDYAAEVHMLGGGAVRLRSLQVELLNHAYWLREFQGGAAVLNPLPVPITVTLPRPMRRLSDNEAPRHVIEVDDHNPGFSCQGAWERRAGEAHYAGPGYRLARKPGGLARWQFVAPASDVYTLLVTVPGGDDRTDSAEYSVLEPKGEEIVVVHQRPGDGGWVRLFEVPLQAGQRCVVMLRSSGPGVTVADALRAESAGRYNDGREVERVSLEALDGVVLRRE